MRYTLVVVIPTGVTLTTKSCKKTFKKSVDNKLTSWYDVLVAAKAVNKQNTKL